MSDLNDMEYKRYARHIVMSEIGTAGQEKLLRSRVLVVGAGGLGSPIALYLAAAGVGNIGIMDGDYVEVSNLQRQIIHSVTTLGKPKVESAKDRIFDLNPEVRVEAIQERMNEQNAKSYIEKYDVVVDATDNLNSRYIMNRACKEVGVPYVYGAVGKFEGQVSVFCHEDGPCYACAYPEAPPEGVLKTTAETGILGVLPGVIGTLQANEVLKLLLNFGTVLKGTILFYDSMSSSFRKLSVRKDPSCPVCSEPGHVKKGQ